jgi:hypothetical protein
MTNDSGTTATPARSAVPEPAGPADVESFGPTASGDPGTGGPGAAARRAGPGDADPDTAEADVPTPLPPNGPAAGPGRVGAPEAPDGGPRVGLPGVGLLAALALSWLAAMLWVAHASISSDVGVVALATAASSLPPVVSAGGVAGAAFGLLAVRLLVRDPERSGIRFGVAVTAGLATGLAAGAAFAVGSGSDPARMALAGTLAAGATIGGAAAGARTGRVVAAVVAAALATFAVGVVFGFFKEPLQGFYGAGDDEASRASASGWFAATVAVVGGVVAGLTAFAYLGGARRGSGLRWPAYLVAGAGTGVLLVATEIIVRTGGAQLLGLVREISDADRALQSWADASRVNNALVVLFVGAITATVALGRTLPPRTAADDDDDAEPVAAADREATTDHSGG